jgi:type I restriction enzyme R subunit
MSYNFDFLKKDKLYESFSGACIEAEKSMLVSYSTVAIVTRRALELAVKWVYSHDEELIIPYDDRLDTLIHDHSFRSIIDARLLPMMRFIKSLGNKAVHTNKEVSKQNAVLSLRNLYEFILWIDYCYSDELHEKQFDESLLQDSKNEKRTKKELQDLNERLSEKDRKLSEIAKENEKLREQLASKRVNNEKQRVFNTDEATEYETRKNLIDVDIELAGWTINDNCIVEVPVKGMPIPPSKNGDGFVDYVLYGDDGKPLALIEAKRTSKDPKIGKRQAKLYADCLEKEHGVRPIIFFTNGYQYFMWDDLSYPDRQVASIFTKSDLEWMIYKRKHKKVLNDVEIDDLITNRYYQKMAIQAVCESFERGHRKSLLVMATGSGKTRTAISIVDVLLKEGWIKNILFLADRKELVRQAKNAFSNLLPSLSTCNLLNDKENKNSKMIFSTYPTMMNAIDSTKGDDGEQLFTPGHFDLIIIDESHRSIYKKYQAIFDYFDSLLVGLTATPKDDIDKNTYSIFDLENNMPTYAYELDQAIEDGFLVPYKAVGTELKILTEGLHYDQLSDEEKEIYEDLFDNDEERDFDSEEINKILFNDDTIDKVLRDLMTNGIKVEGGDKIGKSIIFAKNKKHAGFIVDRFNTIYPEYKGNFMEAIHYEISHAQSAIDDFKSIEKTPQIAVSVDMLDTGVDVPEVVNLVMFKKVRSKSKFWQMIGRGTRLCEDLFGLGNHKTHFKILDYGGNFDFFVINKNEGKEAKLNPSLTEQIFALKLEIIKALQGKDYQGEEYITFRDMLVEDLFAAIKIIDETRFDVKQKLEYIHRYRNPERWVTLTDTDIYDLKKSVCPFVLNVNGDELAKRFDITIYQIMLAELIGVESVRQKNQSGYLR